MTTRHIWYMTSCITVSPICRARLRGHQTFALNNATLPFALAIAEQGYKAAMQRDSHLRNGLNIYRGAVTYEAVASDLGLEYVSAEKALEG